MENRDSFEGEEIIVLKNSEGEEIEFVNVAGIALEEGYFMILQPKELLPDMADDEALVFELKRLDNGEEGFNIVLDDEIVDKVFEEYYRLLDGLEDKE